MGCCAQTHQYIIPKNQLNSNQVKPLHIDEVTQAAALAIEQEQDLNTVVELQLSCQNLPNLDTFSLSDPICVVYIELVPNSDRWKEYGKTEVIMDSLNPTWITSFQADYFFEKQQRFMFEVYDVDDFNQNAPLSKHDYIGSAIFNLHEIIGAPTKKSTKELFNKKSRRQSNGVIEVRGEEVSGIQHLLKFQTPSISLTKNKNDILVYFRINRTSDKILTPIYQSEAKKTVKGQVEFKNVKITICSLCRGDENRQIIFELFQYVHNGKHKLLGNFTTTIQEIRKKDDFFEVHDSNFPQNENNQQTNKSLVAEFDLGKVDFEQKYSFLDYVHGGCEISLLLALDFTRSNGNYEETNSLHYFDKNHPNDYMQAIKSVGEILQYYDSDNKIPVYGFGSKILPFTETTSHCFALNGDIFNPEVDGIDGVLKVYEKAVKNLIFHGPTFFSQIIRMAADYANDQENTQDEQKYFILLIITDGIINDMENTINEIVRASVFPLSIIIVGVGNEDFTLMNELDADQNPLYSKF